MIKNLPGMQETQVQFLGQEDPLEKEMSTHSSMLAEFHGQSSLASYSLWGHTEYKRPKEKRLIIHISKNYPYNDKN